MRVKVCGLANYENSCSVADLSPDYLGFLFYKQSKRYCIPQIEVMPNGSSKRVGVFVNSPLDEILLRIEQYKLDGVQLHGEEPLSFCEELKSKLPEIILIKSFQIGSSEDLQDRDQFSPCCDLFLFDTASPLYGGSGKKFDWSLLSLYKGKTPFLLSGGIGILDVEAILSLSHPLLYGVDINSRFELSPGVKDLNLVSEFIKRIKNESNR